MGFKQPIDLSEQQHMKIATQFLKRYREDLSALERILTGNEM